METTRKTVSGGRVQICCTDCGRFVFADDGGAIRHSLRCDFKADRTCFAAEGAAAATTTAASAKPTDAQIRAAARQGAISRVLDEDEIHRAVNSHLISVSDAMNRDF